MRSTTLAVGLLVAAGPTLPVEATEDLSIVSWNAESGDADPNSIADIMKRSEFDGVDIWGICEVQNQFWADTFELAAEDGEAANFDHVLGTTGGADRLLVIYDADRFELIDTSELHQINIGGRVRAPLVLHLRVAGTDDAFLFVVNHLYRSRADRRHQQATELNLWASVQTLPVICVGDFNFDWSVTDGDADHDEGYDNLVADSVFEWVRPDTLVKTQASPNFDSVLDFVFLANAGAWTGESEILDGLGLFPDTSFTPDHRPVTAQLTTGASPDTLIDSLRAQLLKRIANIESQMAELKAIVNELDE